MNAETFRFLEHTADVRVECRAPDLAGIFRVAAKALYAVALRDTRDDGTVTNELDLLAVNREELLVRWVQELIFLLEHDGFVAVRADFRMCVDTHVVAHLHGYCCNSSERAEEVKSATYHGLEIRDTADGIVARMILDL